MFFSIFRRDNMAKLKINEENVNKKCDKCCDTCSRTTIALITEDSRETIVKDQSY